MKLAKMILVKALAFVKNGDSKAKGIFAVIMGFAVVLMIIPFLVFAVCFVILALIISAVPNVLDDDDDSQSSAAWLDKTGAIIEYANAAESDGAVWTI